MILDILAFIVMVVAIITIIAVLGLDNYGHNVDNSFMSMIKRGLGIILIGVIALSIPLVIIWAMVRLFGGNE